MTDSTIVSNFEKRIRNIQRKKKRNLIVKIVSMCITFSLIVVYFLLPVSKVSNFQVNGNIFYTDEEVLSIAGINKKDSLYLISKDTITKNLVSSPLISDDSVEVKISFTGLKINFEELVPVLKYQSDQILSDGSILDQDLLKSKDPLVGDYLYLHTQNLISVYSKPYENKFVKSRVEHLSKLILSLNEESRSRIYGVDFDSESYYYSFYYQTELENDILLKVVFDSAKKIDDLNVIIDNSKIESYISYLTDKKTEDKFVSFKETLNGEEKNIKSIKVIMQTIDDDIYYHVKYNNPVGTGSIE